MAAVLRRTIWIALLILPAALAFAFAVAWSLSEPLADDPPEPHYRHGAPTS
ncbi:MAG TPA: hypothetical protein VGV07_01205 [Devosia sp.]|uniref:hypothetical protein n=1 Tax=Devosia sp. TaxID=1871048 RepID=UPI002DDCAA43|nr:hypothetical protein [Devosia sp.]HEV2513839.1 hypothetical protein [Devosia sp.]